MKYFAHCSSTWWYLRSIKYIHLLRKNKISSAVRIRHFCDIILIYFTHIHHNIECYSDKQDLIEIILESVVFSKRRTQFVQSLVWKFTYHFIHLHSHTCVMEWRWNPQAGFNLKYMYLQTLLPKGRYFTWYTNSMNAKKGGLLPNSCYFPVQTGR